MCGGVIGEGGLSEPTDRVWEIELVNLLRGRGVTILLHVQKYRQFQIIQDAANLQED